MPNHSGKHRTLITGLIFSILCLNLFSQDRARTFRWDHEATEKIRSELFVRSQVSTTLEIPIPDHPVRFVIHPHNFIRVLSGEPGEKTAYQSFSGRDSLGNPVFGFFYRENLHLSFYQAGVITSIATKEGAIEQYSITRTGDPDSSGEIECAVMRTPDYGIRNGGEDAPCTSNNYSSRTFNLFIVSTGEWGLYFRGNKNNARSAIASHVNVLNAFYKGELNISFKLITDDAYLYTDPGTDPFNTSSSNLADEARDFFNDTIDPASYDLGHVFNRISADPGSISVAGIAYLPAVCNGEYKGGGWTSTSDPNNVNFTFNVFGHEIGHQLGADHNFYGTQGNCEGNRSPGNGYEPGAGNTLMSYEGNCAGHNIQPYTKTHYLNTHSVGQILDWIGSAPLPCGSSSGSGGNISVQIPGDFSVPKSTAFDLNATGNGTYDYIWEQYDTDNSTPTNAEATPIQAGNFTTTPMYRSYDPSGTGNLRSFPSKEVQRTGTVIAGEVYATVARPITMRLMTRSGGNIRCDEMTITVRDAPPLQVTAPGPGESIVLNENEQGRDNMMTVEWETGDTENNGFPTADILYSINGGASFQLLEGGVENDGIHQVRPPEQNTDQARLKIQLSDGSGRMAIYHEQRQNFTVNFSVLPIEIAKFEGHEETDHHTLYWEVNHTGEHIRTLSIEYSYDGVHYNQATTPGSDHLSAGENWSGVYESYFRNGPQTYYRLLVEDAAGKITYSSVLRLENNSGGDRFMSLFPNPAYTPELHLEFRTFLPPNGLIRVWSVNGRKMYEFRADTRLKSLDITTAWPDGLYIVEAIDGRQSYREKLIISSGGVTK